jgi:hypothetical protein
VVETTRRTIRISSTDPKPRKAKARDRAENPRAMNDLERRHDLSHDRHFNGPRDDSSRTPTTYRTFAEQVFKPVLLARAAS